MNGKLISLASFIVALGLMAGSVNAQSLQQDPGPDGIVSVEAENFDANVENGGHAWELTGPTEGFTGTAGMWAPNGQGGHSSNFETNSERLDYEINFVKTGIHYVWILAWGASGSDDSCHAGLDGDATLSSQMSGWNNQYEWNNGRYQAAGPSRIDVTSTGPHTFSLWVREDGLIIDKIVITSNPDFTLSGNEPGPPESFWGAILNAHSPDPADGALHAATWAGFSWSAGETATSHDVYLGESFDDVNNRTAETFRGNQPTPSLIVGFAGSPYPDGLVEGTAYYWRVDEVEADGTTKHEGPVWSFRVPPLNAYDPSPPDGAVYQDTDTPLTWSSGLNAALHTLYFGDNFEDVNSAAVPGIARPAAGYAPSGPLEHDKTYYWRVDQLNPPTTTKGEVWSFRTLPEIPLAADPSLVGWWKFEAGKGARIVDWSGQGNHGTVSGAGNMQWVTSTFNLGLEFLGDYQGYVELPPGLVTTGAGSVLMWINTTQDDDEGMLWYGSAVDYGNGYGGENEIHVNIDDPGAGEVDFFLEEDGSGSDITIDGPEVGGQGWTHIAATWDLVDGCRLYVNGAQVGSEPHNTNVQDLAIIRLGSAAEDDVFYEGVMDDVRLFDRALSADEIVEILSKGEDPDRPGSPQPGNSALVTLIEATSLSWSPGEGASEHDVYFGTDGDAVANAGISDTTGMYRGRQSTTTYTTSQDVEWAGGPYYWRIDEISGDGTPTKGGVWSFSVADYLIVDDFESYNDIVSGEPGSNLIYETWIDGFDNPTTNGSAAGYIVPFEPTMESGIVHGGIQSAPLLYDNGTATSSEITANTAELPVGRNWTIGSPQTLVLWFHGNPANATSERLYVKVNGVEKTYPGNATDVADVRWEQWNIDLASFGIDLTNVTQVSVGLERTGASGGTGTVLIDDIRLYRIAPEVVVPSEEVWIEAETATSISAPMQIYDDPSASGGRYIGTDAGIGNESDTPPVDGVAAYSFTVQGGIYKVTGRVIIPAGDSFWVRIPGATDLTPGEDPDNPGTGWVRWSDPPDGDAWHWEDVFSGDHAGETANWTLPAGTHTLEIARREDGALLDAIVISRID